MLGGGTTVRDEEGFLGDGLLLVVGLTREVEPLPAEVEEATFVDEEDFLVVGIACECTRGDE